MPSGTEPVEVQPDAVATVPSSADDAAPAPKRQGFLRRRGQLYASLPGCWGALLFACLSFTPSLLPRGGALQGLIAGIDAAIGYGLGVWAACVWRAFADRGPRPPRPWAWRTFDATAVVLLAGFFALGQYWQHQIRDLMGVSDYSIPLVVASPFIAVAVFAGLVRLGRWLRSLYRRTAGWLDRRMGHRPAKALGWLLVATGTYLVVSGLLLNGLVYVANEAFSLKNGLTPDGVHQPTTSLRSGGPGSLVPWDTLGYQGRKFSALGPSVADISGFAHHSAMEPIRAYVGLESAGNTEARAELAVDELEHQGAFQRKDLLVITTTGSGWVDPASIDTFEYLTGGDSAAVAMQYSYLPSWISYLVDQSKAREAGRALFDAVYGHWSKLPPDSRPRLFVAGESLGSFGGEAAFSGEYDMRNRTNGILFAGPPNFNTLFREFSDNRDSGSPEVQPVYKGGRTVRFANNPEAAIPPEGKAWNGSRVLYMNHPSDPIVWWSPRLILRKPDWISQAPGQDVLKGLVWIPFVTFWQVSGDLPFSTGVPGGHGHKYTTEYVDGWNAVLRTHATAQNLSALRTIIGGG